MTCEQVVFSKVLKIPQAPVKILVLKFLYHSLQLPIIKSHHFFFSCCLWLWLQAMSWEGNSGTSLKYNHGS